MTTGLVLTVTFVASEALAVVTIMPVVARDLSGLRLYGWVFSAFMLGSVIGIVAAGRAADRRGPAAPFVAGLLLFGAGLTIAGLAPSMAVLVGGRVLQGTGAGAVPAVAYATIGRSLAGQARARMMAVMSTAWVLPGLAGPAVSAEVAHLFGWRWVFLGLLPVVAVTGSVAVPSLVRLGAPAQRPPGGPRLADGIAVAGCAALILAGLTLAAGTSHRALPLMAGGALIAIGVLAGLPAFRRLVPQGTLTARPGLPATILSRGVLTFAFFGADAYVTLSITTLRHQSPVVASVAVTGATLTWTAGAWIQARLGQSRQGRSLVRAGFLVILAGIGGMVWMLRPGVPVAVGQVSWAVAGLGMGLAYPTISLLMLREAPTGGEGATSASLNLADVLGTAIGIGVSGAAVTASTGHDLLAGVTIAFIIAAAAGVAGLGLTRRLPAGPAAASSPSAAASSPSAAAAPGPGSLRPGTGRSTVSMFGDTEAFSGFAVDDLDKARQFYGETLGIRTSEQYGLMMLDLAGDRGTLVYPKPDHVPASYTILNFKVDDIDGAVDELTARGVQFLRYDGVAQDERGINRAGGPYIAWFTDPAGNILSVLQDR